jgi:uncharacterized protein with von Willebrand factor type A (vWA) domain
MRARLLALVDALRAEGLPISVAESIDAADAAGAVGFARAELRDALAATLVKDESDRPLFERTFDRVFPARMASDGARKRRGARTAPEGGEGATGGSGGAAGSPRGGAPRPSPRAGAPRDPDAPKEPSRALRPTERPAAAHGDRTGTRQEGETPAEAAGPPRTAALRALPFAAMSPRDVDAAAALVRALARRFRARLRRRLRPRVRERLDFRRTIRAAVARGGVLIERRERGRRPGKPRLVALCDVSASVATATDFFLALLAPAAPLFREVRLFGFVDRLVEIEFVDGQVRPAGPLDLMARSDFGRVLRDLHALAAAEALLGPDTLLLVLGDARNNRRPPRADLLAAARARVRQLLWLNPEPRVRWDTGDSAMAAYARSADAVLGCGSLAELDAALAVLAKS